MGIYHNPEKHTYIIDVIIFLLAVSLGLRLTKRTSIHYHTSAVTNEKKNLVSLHKTVTYPICPSLS
jgi:hypothetical protein